MVTLRIVALSSRSFHRAAPVAAALFLMSAPGRLGAQQTFEACYVPSVGAMYLINLPGLPTQCLGTGHVAISWTEGQGGTVTSITAGDGLTGGTITTTGTLSVDFAGPGFATTVARSDHTHARSGLDNTGVGVGALEANTGNFNTALGTSALRVNTSGGGNTAVGSSALSGNDVGINNSAFGTTALTSNAGGSSNSAFGVDALADNTVGQANAAFGLGALGSNLGGNSNSAFGTGALSQLASGSDNVGLGNSAGFALTDGSFNIYVGSNTSGGSTESFTIRIGSNQTAAYVAGISGRTSTSGATVLVNSAGKLGTTTSSIRFKEDVEDLGDLSARLYRLRPVRFRYRPEYDDGSRLMQYGLIAEEVERVFPELVLYGQDGRVETVRYHLLSVLLLNELQRQERQRRRQEDELAELRKALAAHEAMLAELRAAVER